MTVLITYLNITNNIQAKIPSPEEDLSKNDIENEFNEQGVAAAVDDFLTFDILADIFLYDINKIKKNPETDFDGGRKFLR